MKDKKKILGMTLIVGGTLLLAVSQIAGWNSNLLLLGSGIAVIAGVAVYTT